MPYPATLTRAALDARRADRQEARMPVIERTPGADDDLTALQRRTLLAFADATPTRTWADTHSVLPHYGVLYPDEPRRTYGALRGVLLRLARDGYLRASPQGQPPGAHGLTFSLTQRGHAAVIDAGQRATTP